MFRLAPCAQNRLTLTYIGFFSHALRSRFKTVGKIVESAVNHVFFSALTRLVETERLSMWSKIDNHLPFTLSIWRLRTVFLYCKWVVVQITENMGLNSHSGCEAMFSKTDVDRNSGCRFPTRKSFITTRDGLVTECTHLAMTFFSHRFAVNFDLRSLCRLWVWT